MQGTQNRGAREIDRGEGKMRKSKESEEENEEKKRIKMGKKRKRRTRRGERSSSIAASGTRTQDNINMERWKRIRGRG